MREDSSYKRQSIIISGTARHAPVAVMMDPWKAYATLLDCVYFKAIAATMRSVAALGAGDYLISSEWE